MDIRAWLEQTLGLAPEQQLRAITSLVIIVVLWASRRLVLRVVARRNDDTRVRYKWNKGTSYVAVPVGLFLILRVWIGGLPSLATYFGLLSAGVAIALRDPLVNLAAWAFILWRRPFEVGDRIEIGQAAGDVIDQRIFAFTLMEIGNWVNADQSTGRVIHIPNGVVFTAALANYTKGFQFIWNEIAVLVTFESDWQKAKRLLGEIADRNSLHLSEEAEAQVRHAANRFMIYYRKLTPVVYTSVADCGVMLTIRYLCKPRRRRTSAEAMWEDILRAFAACEDIDFAYPTQRFYDNPREGKPGASPAVPVSPG